MTRWRYVPDRLRWLVARWLDKRHLEACWARLAMWSLWPDNEESVRDALRPDESCRRACERWGTCYCGKHVREVGGR